MIEESLEDLPSEVADLIAARRDDIARVAAQELGDSGVDELPKLLHRLAGKLGAFGHVTAGDAARRLMVDLGEGTLPRHEVDRRVRELIELLGGRSEAVS